MCVFQSWSGPEKLLALDELIDSCEPTQVKHMMQVIEPQFQRDFISLLPKEVGTHTHTHTHAHARTHTESQCSDSGVGGLKRRLRERTDGLHTHTGTERRAC